MKAKKLLSLGIACTMAAGLLAGCGASSDSIGSTATGDTGSEASTSTAATDGASGKVYYLNFKPEQDQQWQDPISTDS